MSNTDWLESDDFLINQATMNTVSLAEELLLKVYRGLVL